jgi:hypothetical protein
VSDTDGSTGEHVSSEGDVVNSGVNVPAPTAPFVPPQATRFPSAEGGAQLDSARTESAGPDATMAEAGEPIPSSAGTELPPSSGSPAPGWWLATDGRWYPPKVVAEPLAPQSNGPMTRGANERFCWACGSTVLESAAFCLRCGTPSSGPVASRPPSGVQPMHPSSKSKTTALLLAVFLGGWTWLYTYERDSTKFWIFVGVGILGGILTLVFVGFLILLGLQIWAIVDVATKPDAYYERFPT